MFMRGENIVCGTTTTGTGTLTLAACPSAVGGIDVVASGLFGTSGAWPCRPVIIEYTDNTYTTPSKVEVGADCILTMAGSIGSCTLTRNPAVTITGGAASNSSPSAVSIGTAANVLVFFGPTSQDITQNLNSYSTSGITTGDGLGIAPQQGQGNTGTLTFTMSGGSGGVVIFQRVKLDFSGLIKSVTVRVQGPRTSPTSNSLAGALFEVSSTGLPGKKVIDFGTASGTTGAPLGVAGNVTLTATSAVYVPAGYYILGILPVWNSGSATPTLQGCLSTVTSPFGTSLTTAGGPIGTCTVAAGDLNDPPTTTSITLSTSRVEVACTFRST